jgi:hypothetical protein
MGRPVRGGKNISMQTQQIEKQRIPTVKEAELALKIPTIMWKGDCYGIVVDFLKRRLVKGRAAYGHWLGPISTKSIFSKRRHMPFVRHGWIVTKKGKIIDPTRWVFEAKKPYIFYGDNSKGYYDEGGNKYREANLDEAPIFDIMENKYPIVLSEPADEHLHELLCQDPRDEICMSQLLYIGNLSPNTLGIFCKEIYQWIKNIGLKALIPIDNWIMIMGRKR